jgi:hypothetical protein
MGKYRVEIVVCLGIAALLGAVSSRALDPAVKCEADKNREAGKHAYCLQKARARLLTTHDTRVYAAAVQRCNGTFNDKWQRLEDRAAREGVPCPDGLGDPNLLADFITEQSDAVGLVLEGAGMPHCGDGAVNVAGEHCDGTDVDGYTCADFGLLGSLSCTGSCDFDATGCFNCIGIGGVVVGGHCWFYGAAGQSCETLCGALALSYDEATRTFAGSDGSAENCNAVLTALTVKGVPADDDGCGDYQGRGNGRGCATLNAIGRCPESPPREGLTDSCWWRDLGSTDAAAAHSSTERACACE